jgi:PAS domain S-box-containing protein
VRTHDEVEVLDHVIADLTARLKRTYDHLEELVAERTEQLKREYALDRAILDSIEYGVMTLDALGNITDVNPAFLKLLGRTQEECTGKSGIDILQLSQKRSEFALENHPITQCLRNRKSFRSSATMHLSLLKKDQTLLPVLLMATPLLEGERLLGGIVIFQDMTEDRQIDYMKSEFITLASHQLRTPLSAVRWNLELFGDATTKLTEDEKAYIVEIEQSSRRMAKVLDELLHAARLEEGGYAYEKQDVNLTAVLQRIVDENAIVAQASGVTLVPEFAKLSIQASTDPILLEIIIQNLIGNAIKYSEKGSNVEFTMEQSGDFVLIHVIDHGFGIPVHEQKRVFEKFFRAHNVRQKDTDGTGLGLYISKRALESLGGTISFVSAEGKGSTFTVKLPLK